MVDAMAASRSPAVKRLLQEWKELSAGNSADFACQPLEDNVFEWHFALRGPRDTEFEGGVYHGRILLPPEYPFKPPAFSFLTPNGRFEVGVKICLSISAHHPEHWQPSWGVRTALVALTAFMPTKGDGAIGALDYTAAERRALAAASVGPAAPATAGQAEPRAQVTRDVHARLMRRAAEAEAEAAARAAGGGGDGGGSGDAAAPAPAAAAAAAAAEPPPPPPRAAAPPPPPPARAAAAAASAAAASGGVCDAEDTLLLAAAAALSALLALLLLRRVAAWAAPQAAAGGWESAAEL